MNSGARRKDGEYRWFFIRYNPLLDEHGHPIRWYAAGIDIDDRKRAEERMQSENVALRERNRQDPPCSRKSWELPSR